MSERVVMVIEECWFWRTRKSEVERGLLLGGEKLIVDLDYKPVRRIYRYERTNRLMIIHPVVEFGV